MENCFKRDTLSPTAIMFYNDLVMAILITSDHGYSDSHDLNSYQIMDPAAVYFPPGSDDNFLQSLWYVHVESHIHDLPYWHKLVPCIVGHDNIHTHSDSIFMLQRLEKHNME